MPVPTFRAPRREDLYTIVYSSIMAAGEVSQSKPQNCTGYYLGTKGDRWVTMQPLQETPTFGSMALPRVPCTLQSTVLRNTSGSLGGWIAPTVPGSTYPNAARHGPACHLLDFLMVLPSPVRLTDGTWLALAYGATQAARAAKAWTYVGVFVAAMLHHVCPGILQQRHVAISEFARVDAWAHVAGPTKGQPPPS